MYIIEIENGNKPCYVAAWEEGDPPRTVILENAQTFCTKKEAENRINEVILKHPFRTLTYKIVEASII